MRYVILNALFLIPILLVGLRYFKKQQPRAIVYTTLFVLALTMVFDSLIIKLGIVGYNIDHILGVYVWHAPIEDFAYSVASVLLVALLWEYHETKK